MVTVILVATRTEPEPPRSGEHVPGSRAAPDAHGTMAGVRRVNVIGSSGSGKTTFARALARRCSLLHVELDAIYHQPDWQQLDPESFRAEVARVTAGAGWVVDGNYATVRDIIWARADTVVFLDLPRWRVMSQLVPRTLRRIVTRQTLWNGNRERWQNFYRLDPEENLIVWSFTRHALYRARYDAASIDPEWAHLDFFRLRSPQRIRDFLEGRFGR